MPLYRSKFSYTPEAWTRLIRNPEDRRRAAQWYIESVAHMTATTHGRRPTTCPWPELRWRLLPEVRFARSKRQSS